MKKVVVVAALAMGAVACRIGEDTYVVETYQAESTSKTVTCDSPFVAVDLSTLKACGNADQGKGHCYDKTKGQFDPTQLTAPGCDDGELCVPDKVLQADGKKLTACTSFGGEAGACTSLLQQELNANKSAVPQDVCDADERCAPCIDPRTGKPDGTCDAQGAHEAACTGGAASADVQLCCHGAGTCIQKSAVPGGDADKLSQDVCSKDAEVCAPTALVNGKPTKCDVLGVSGVCIDYCFANMLQGAKAIMQGGCQATEACLPCIIGKGQGLPGCD